MHRSPTWLSDWTHIQGLISHTEFGCHIRLRKKTRVTPGLELRPSPLQWWPNLLTIMSPRFTYEGCFNPMRTSGVGVLPVLQKEYPEWKWCLSSSYELFQNFWPTASYFFEARSGRTSCFERQLQAFAAPSSRITFWGCEAHSLYLPLFPFFPLHNVTLIKPLSGQELRSGHGFLAVAS